MAKKVLMTGNDAMAEGAIRAGCRYYYGYPITPQNEVPEYMSRRMPQVGGVFIQSESELAAVNMVLGSAAAGKRAMTSSSSPGISLKQEGLSYIAGSELPAVIANVQRGGPGLGDIGASQADYWQATKGGGHGDYRLIVLAPASVQEMADLATLAFDIADRWRNPVMILADAQVGQMMEPVVWREYTPPRDLPAKDWALTGADGRPKRIVKSFFLYPGDLEKHNIRLQKKYAEISKREVRYEEVRTKDADLVIIAYGSSARIAKGLVAKGVNGGRVGLLRPITVWPFPTERIRELAEDGKAFLVAEMSAGQMLEDVRLAVEGRAPVGFYGRIGGAMLTIGEMDLKAREMLSQLAEAGK
ncbi:MAG: 3-methyl-2-oxobutanoate dehydrogenase subunit VorB [Planctomycetota bacterium]|jgi:2-oxoglutarate ferredoxin oxidoreductase subunit alpha